MWPVKAHSIIKISGTRQHPSEKAYFENVYIWDSALGIMIFNVHYYMMRKNKYS